MYRLGLFVFACLLFFPCPASSFCQDGQRPVEYREVKDTFHRNLLQAAVKARQEGKITREDVLKIRIAMMTPAGRSRIEDLAFYQMGFSGSENTPVGDDGKIDRASIDWDKLLAFLEKLLPFILQMIDAFSWMESPHPMLRQLEFYAVMNTPFELAC